MNSIWDIGEIFLELLCVSFMLGFFIVGINILNNSTEIVRRDMYASDAQIEYSTFSVYDGTDIAYTEVLECIYTYSSNTFPIYISSGSSLNSDPDINYDVKYTKVTSTYKQLSDYLRSKTLIYRGEVLRREGGTMYGIRFIY